MRGLHPGRVPLTLVKATAGCGIRKACSRVLEPLPLGSTPLFLLHPLQAQPPR